MPLIQPRKRIYVAFNHVPNGQICVQHFDHVVRDKKIGDDRVETIHFTPEEQIKGFEKSDFVAIMVNGTIVKNKVMVYSGPDLAWDDPQAKQKVVEWAKTKGLREIFSEKEKGIMATAIKEKGKMEDVENRMSLTEKRIGEMDEKLDRLLTAANRK